MSGRGPGRGGGGPRGDRGGSRGDRGGGPRGGGGGFRGDRGGGPRGGGGGFRGDRGGGYRGGGGGPRGDRGRGFRGGGYAPAEIFRPEVPAAPPSAAVTQKEDEAVDTKIGTEMSMKQLSLSNSNLPPRPGHGTFGRAVVVRTNYFELLPDPKAKLYKYRIDIAPEEKVVRKRRRVFALLFESNPSLQSPGIATDYANTMISGTELDTGSSGFRSMEITYRDVEEAAASPRATVYTIKISDDGTVGIPELLDYLQSKPGNPNWNWSAKAEAIQALNIVMARTPNTTANTVFGAGNKYFPYPTSFPRDNRGYLVNDLGGGLVALRGYYASVRTSTLRVLVNVNICTSAFYPAVPLLDLMNMRSPDNISDYKWIEPFIKKLRVSTHYMKDKEGKMITKVKTISGFSKPSPPKNARQMMFRCEEINSNKDISVEEYFATKYHIQLRSPQLGLINVGNAGKATYIPAELCHVFPGQMFKKKVEPDQTAQMIKIAVKPPTENAKSIIGEGLRLVGIGASNTSHAHFGINIVPKMITVPARILTAPSIVYKTGTVVPREGSWNMVEKKFTVPMSMKSWSYLKINPRRTDTGLSQEVRDGLVVFQQTLSACGLGNEKPGIFPDDNNQLGLGETEDENDFLISDRLKRITENTNTAILLVILPDTNAVTYARLKFHADVTYGIHTVCAVASPKKFLNKSSDASQKQYCANIALKMNLKRGGVNQSLASDKLGILQDGKTMVVGIDVTHPSPGSVEGAPSIAGVVASVDKHYAQWPASVRAQKGREEMVQGLEDMIVERLTLWRTRNGNVLPSKILVYRDGVSEGQYEIVLTTELPSIKSAVKRLYPANAPRPQVTIIIVGKRHHTRFYPTDEADADAKTGNPLNGLVVDRGIVMERGWDFFLQAHKCLQGTARPAHYVIIHNEMGLGANALEQLTHNLCYMFGRATKAVSICPPAYYADLLCARARVYLQKSLNNALGTDTGSVASGPVFDWERAPWTRGVHEKLKNSMFYI